MRAANTETGWLQDDAGNVIGVLFGHDGCFQHEQGIAAITSAFGVPTMEYPIGLADRKATVCPDNVRFVEYTHRSKDKRRKKGIPAAVLLYVPMYWDEAPTAEDLVRKYDLTFIGDMGDKWHRPIYDLRCAWDGQGFGLNVRGTENVERLKRVHQAILGKDVCFGNPTAQGFLRTGMALAIFSEVPAESAAAVEARDRAHKRLIEAAKASGIEELLEKAGKKGSISPDWYNRQKEEGLVFFVDPSDRRSARYGWFLLEDVKLWAQDKGPILMDARLAQFEAAFSKAHRDWSIKLAEGLAAAGIKQRFFQKMVWVDEAKTRVGLYMVPSHDSAHLLPTGVYPLEEMMEKYIGITEATTA